MVSPSAVDAAAKEDVELGELVRRRALVFHDLRRTQSPSHSRNLRTLGELRHEKLLGHHEMWGSLLILILSVPIWTKHYALTYDIIQGLQASEQTSQQAYGRSLISLRRWSAAKCVP